MMKRDFASIGGCASPTTLYGRTCASTKALPQNPKSISMSRSLERFSDFKLKKADTTHNLSLEKGKRKRKSLLTQARRGIYTRGRGVSG